MKELVAKNIFKTMGNMEVLKGINISIERGMKLCLLGPSGCGKTTLLRIIAGLDKQDAGDIFFRNKIMTNIPPYRRNFGMMFQEFALFPHRNVFDNIAFGLEMKGKSKKEIKARVDEMLELVSLNGYKGRRVDELSGGERQRVALARTLAPSPDLLMLDEPLGAMDRLLKERLLRDLCSIINLVGITTIFVTHDQNEAFAFADLICVMHSGKVDQIDTPAELYNYPCHKNVAEFLGFQNIINGTTKNKNMVETKYGNFVICSENIRFNGTDRDIYLLMLPDSASLLSEDDFLICNGNKISGYLSEIFFKGTRIRILVKTNIGDLFSFEMPGGTILPKQGETLFLSINPSGLRQIEQ